MYRIAGCIIALFIFSTSSLFAQFLPTDTIPPVEHSYKHFAGTVGSHNAEMDLELGAEGGVKYGNGTCYFKDESGLYFFNVGQQRTSSHSAIFTAQVFPENIPMSDVKDAYSIHVQTSRFEFTLSNDTLRGRWFVPNTQEPLIITLKEDNNSIFTYDHATDSATVTRNDIPVKTSADYSGVELSLKVKGKERSFIIEAFRTFIGCDKMHETPGHELSQICFRKFIADFSHAAHKGGDMGGSSFTGNYTIFPVYTDNGFLVLQKGGYQYDFENKEYSDKNTYLCLDMTVKKALALNDVLDANNTALATLLENAFRKKYQIDAGQKLNNLFIKDKLPVTDNFALVNKGIIFSYSPVKIFRDDTDISELQEMRVFLSYNELASLLKPGFRKRIGMQ